MSQWPNDHKFNRSKMNKLGIFLFELLIGLKFYTKLHGNLDPWSNDFTGARNHLLAGGNSSTKSANNRLISSQVVLAGQICYTKSQCALNLLSLLTCHEQCLYHNKQCLYHNKWLVLKGLIQKHKMPLWPWP
jgi:hypothetical protein